MTEEQFVALARHHRECEMAGEAMADLLRHIAQGRRPSDLNERATNLVTSWDHHQWPDLHDDELHELDDTRARLDAAAVVIEAAKRVTNEDDQDEMDAAWRTLCAALDDFEALP